MPARLTDALKRGAPDEPAQQRHVVLLTHLGSLYPFTRASELLDELDISTESGRRGVAPGDD